LTIVVAVIFRLKNDLETDNVEPLSVITIGAVRAKKNVLSTFAATTNMASEVSTKVNVHIVQTKSRWADSATGIGGGGEEETFGSDTLELKVLSSPVGTQDHVSQ
jgi:hypothetical protein